MTLYLTPRLYRLLLLSGLLCLTGYIWSPMLWVGQVLAGLIAIGIGSDLWLLWQPPSPLSGSREAPSRFSHNDIHRIQLAVQHHYPFQARVALIDEIPEQFARADVIHTQLLAPGERWALAYELKPLFRGEYSFGRMRAFVSSPIGLLERAITLADKQVIPAYPAFRRLRQFALQGTTDRRAAAGQQRLATLGQQQEFEHIRAYVRGDDVRTLNWKATARQRRLMVNQYQDARARSVYCLIDQSQLMEESWEEVSFLDHAINATVMIAHVALGQQDRVGVATFHGRMEPWLPLQNRPAQVQRILEHLYKVEAQEGVANFERLYATIRQKIPQRSSLILFTHLPTRDYMLRQLPALQRIAARHQLLLVCFEPMETHAILEQVPESPHALRIQTLARQRLRQHQGLLHELQRRGVLVLSSRPDELRLATLNRYLSMRKGP